MASYLPETGYNTGQSSKSGTSFHWTVDADFCLDYNAEVMLGEFEYLLVTATMRLGEQAYGASIRQEIATTTGRACSIGALYTTIDRLEAKGLVRTWMGEPTAERGGRAKRMVQITPAGAKAAKDFYRAVSAISRGVIWAERKRLV